MGQDTPTFLIYSLHFLLIMFTISVAVFQKEIRYKKLIYSVLSVFYACFLYLQISSIIENETTLRIITHTKLNISYILFSLVCFLLLINRGKLAFYFWLIVGVQGILYYLSFNLTGTGFNESIPFHLKTGIKGAGIGDFYRLIIDITLLVALFIFSSFFCFKKIIKKETKEKTMKAKIPVFLMLVLLLFNPLNYDIYQTYKVVDEDPKFLFKDNYQPPKQPVKNETKYNLVWIYAEAFERIYLNQEIFPDLASNLAQLEKESLSFSNVHQVWGTGWTIAGIASSQCGVPLYAVGRENNDLDQLPSFLPKIKGVGNILAEDGYKNIFIQGSPKAFAGNDKFLESHGFQMFSLENIDEKYKTPRNLSRWGLNDDKTLEFAKEKYKELKSENQPFSIMISTINTHSPRGFVPPDFKKKRYKNGQNVTLNALHVSDYLISEFINEIKKLDTEKNTMIVISSDHLTMRNMVSETLERHPDLRRNLFMIHFPDKISPRISERNTSSLDEGVTVLNAMGYPLERFGLGVSLFSNEKNLKEKTQNKTDDVLKSWKKYYFQFWE